MTRKFGVTLAEPDESRRVHFEHNPNLDQSVTRESTFGGRVHRRPTPGPNEHNELMKMNNNNNNNNIIPNTSGSNAGYGPLICTAVVKFVLVLFTITVVCLVGVEYAEWYNIVLTYLFCFLTLLYSFGSVVAYIFATNNAPWQLPTLAVAETLVCAVCLMGWILICAVCGDIALQTNEQTGTPFGWASGIAGLNIIICLALLVINCGQIFLTQEAPVEYPKAVPVNQQRYVAPQY